MSYSTILLLILVLAIITLILGFMKKNSFLKTTGVILVIAFFALLSFLVITLSRMS